MQHFLQGCIKKGCSGCFATRACGGGPRKDVFTPNSALAVSALPAEPAPHTCPQSAGTRGWKQLSTDCPGGVMDPEYPDRVVSASADAEYGPFFIKKASVLYFNLT